MYELTDDLVGMRAIATGYMGRFNEAFKLLRMDLVLFHDALEHVMRTTPHPRPHPNPYPHPHPHPHPHPSPSPNPHPNPSGAHPNPNPNPNPNLGAEAAI